MAPSRFASAVADLFQFTAQAFDLCFRLDPGLLWGQEPLIDTRIIKTELPAMSFKMQPQHLARKSIIDWWYRLILAPDKPMVLPDCARSISGSMDRPERTSC
jgi:hypothetical protein